MGSMSASENTSGSVGQKRWYLLDTLRGLAVINMILYHFFYDVFEIFQKKPGWSAEIGSILWQQWICWTFILISGMSYHFSRSHLKRGLLLNLWGFLITGITLLVLPDETIWFGILNFLGLGILITSLLEKKLRRVPPLWGLILSFGLFLLTNQVPSGYLGAYELHFLELPDALYRFFPLSWLGFPPSGFYSSDYFPVLPWIFLFWAGYYLYILVKGRVKDSSIVFRNQLPFLSCPGRKTLWLYLLHQPLCMLICMLLY